MTESHRMIASIGFGATRMVRRRENDFRIGRWNSRGYPKSVSDPVGCFRDSTRACLACPSEVPWDTLISGGV
eukprot:1661664-Pyramimonas_sp.AAC.1